MVAQMGDKRREDALTHPPKPANYKSGVTSGLNKASGIRIEHMQSLYTSTLSNFKTYSNVPDTLFLHEEG